MSKYLSTDPNAGAAYLSTDPNAGDDSTASVDFAATMADGAIESSPAMKNFTDTTTPPKVEPDWALFGEKGFAPASKELNQRQREAERIQRRKIKQAETGATPATAEGMLVQEDVTGATLANPGSVTRSDGPRTGTDGPLAFGVDQAQQMVGNGLSALGSWLDSDLTKRVGDSIGDQREDILAGGYKSSHNFGFRKTLAEDGLSGALGWMAEKGLENAPNSGFALAGGAAASLAALYSAPLAVSIAGGVTFTNWMMNTGDVAQEFKDKGISGPMADQTALLGGALAAALDSLSVGKAFPKDKLLKMTTSDAILSLARAGHVDTAKLVSREVLKKTGWEMGTELAQKGVAIGGAAAHGAQYTPAEVMDKLIDEAVAAGPVAAVGAGVSSGMDVAASKSPKARAEVARQRALAAWAAHPLSGGKPSQSVQATPAQTPIVESDERHEEPITEPGTPLEASAPLPATQTVTQPEVAVDPAPEAVTQTPVGATQSAAPEAPMFDTAAQEARLTLPPTPDLMQSNGNPFASKETAELVQRINGMQGTHLVVPSEDGGYTIRAITAPPVVPVTGTPAAIEAAPTVAPVAQGARADIPGSGAIGVAPSAVPSPAPTSPTLPVQAALAPASPTLPKQVTHASVYDRVFKSKSLASREVRKLKLKKVQVVPHAGGFRIAAAGRGPVADSHNLIQRIKQLGGINLSYRQDVIGDTSGYPVGLFAKGGKGLDDLATELRADGFDINTDDVDGGVMQLTNMIRDAANGTPIHTMEETARLADVAREQDYRDQLKTALEELGQPYAKNAKTAKLITLLEAKRAELKAAVEAKAAKDAEALREVIGDEMTPADWDTLLNAAEANVFGYDQMVVHEKENTDAAYAEYQAENQESPGALHPRPTGEDHPTGRDQPQAGRVEEDQAFRLEAPTPAQLRAQDAAAQAREKAAADEIKAQEKAAADAATKARVDAAPFVLGQNADDAVSGQDAMFSKKQDRDLQSEYEIRPDTTSNSPIDGAALRELRRAAAGIESPEKGITFRVDEDGRAIVTGPARVRVPDRFQRFANDNGLTLVVRRGPVDSITTNKGNGGPLSVLTFSQGAVNRAKTEKFQYGASMPLAYRESGALYFGEVGNAPGDGPEYLDRTGKASFSRSTSPLQNLKDSAIKARDAFRERDKLDHIDDPDEFFRLSGKWSDARVAFADEIAKLPDDGFALRGETGDGRLLLLNASTKGDGWQLTRFAEDGLPWGDSQYSTKKEAVREFLHEAKLETVTDFNQQFSQSQSPVVGAHTKASFQSAQDAIFGVGFASGLEAAGTAEYITRDQIPAELGGAAFSKQSEGMRDLVEKSRDTLNANSTVDIGALPEWEADAISNALGVDGASYRHTADVYAVKHTLKKHGDAAVEKSRNQLRVTEDDITKIPDVVMAPDSIILGIKNSRQQDLVFSVKAMPDGTMLVAEEVRTGAMGLALVSVRKVPGAKNAKELLPSVLLNVRGDAGVNPIIVDAPKSGNPDIRYSQDGSTLAYVLNGKVTFVVDNIGSNDNVKGLTLHEIGLHAKQLGRTGKAFKAILAHAELMRKAGNAAMVAARARVPKATPSHLVPEETLGYFIEQNPDTSFARRIIAWFKGALLNLGVPAKWVRLNEKDISAMAMNALRGEARSRDGVFNSESTRKSLSDYFLAIASRVDNWQSRISYAKDIETLTEEMTVNDKLEWVGEQDGGVIHIGVKRFDADFGDYAADSMATIQGVDSRRPHMVIIPAKGRNVQGSLAYQIGMAWAHNNGKLMEPDTTLTPINRLRRTEAMIASMLRFGTSTHVAPHQDQFVGLLRDKDYARLDEYGHLVEGRAPFDTADLPEIEQALLDLRATLWEDERQFADGPERDAAFKRNLDHMLLASAALVQRRSAGEFDGITINADWQIVSRDRDQVRQVAGLPGRPEAKPRISANGYSSGIGDTTVKRFVQTKFLLGANGAGWVADVLPQRGESDSVYRARLDTLLAARVADVGDRSDQAADSPLNYKVLYSKRTEDPARQEKLRENFAEMVGQGDERVKVWMRQALEGAEKDREASDRFFVPHADTEVAAAALAERAGWNSETMAELLAQPAVEIDGRMVQPAEILSAASMVQRYSVVRLLEAPNAEDFTRRLADTINLMVATRANLSEIGRALGHAGWLQRNGGAMAGSPGSIKAKAGRVTKIANGLVTPEKGATDEERAKIAEYNKAMRDAADLADAAGEAEAEAAALAQDIEKAKALAQAARQALHDANQAKNDAKRRIKEANAKAVTWVNRTPLAAEIAAIEAQARAAEALAVKAVEDMRAARKDLANAKLRLKRALRTAAEALAAADKARAARDKALAAHAKILKPGVSADDIKNALGRGNWLLRKLGWKYGIARMQAAIAKHGHNLDVDTVDHFLRGLSVAIFDRRKERAEHIDSYPPSQIMRAIVGANPTSRAAQVALDVADFHFFGVVFEMFRAMILTGFRTHEINMTANAAVSAIELGLIRTMAEAMPGGVGVPTHIKAVWSGMARTVTQASAAFRYGVFSEYPAKQFEVLASATPSARQMIENIGGGASKWIEGHGSHATPGMVGRVARTVGFSPLGAEDSVAKIAPYHYEIGKQRASGQTVDYAKAVNLAVTNTMQADLDAWAAWVPKLPPSVLLLTQITFVKTLVNLTKWGLKNTLVTSQLMHIPELTGQRGVEARNLALARTALSLMVASTVLWLYGDGEDDKDNRLRGLPPTDPQDRELWEAAYGSVLGLKVGDEWYDMSRFDPVSGSAALIISGRNAALAAYEGDPRKAGQAVANAVHQIIIGKNWMKGPKDFMDSIQRGGLWGDEEHKGYFNDKLPKSILGGILVPNMISQIGDVFDPLARDPHSLTESLMRKIPGQRETLDPKLGIDGKPIASTRHGSVLPATHSPKQDDVAKWLVKNNISLDILPKSLDGLPLEIRAELLADRYENLKSVMATTGGMSTVDIQDEVRTEVTLPFAWAIRDQREAEGLPISGKAAREAKSAEEYDRMDNAERALRAAAAAAEAAP